MGAGRAPQALGIGEHPVAVPVDSRIFALGLNVGAANPDGPQFIGTDAAVENLLAARFGIKGPVSGPLEKRYRKGPAVRPKLQNRLGIALLHST